MDKAEIPSRLAHFPINFFAMIMGLAGLTLAWQKITPLLALPLPIALGLAYFSTVLFALLLLVYLGKSVLYPAQVKQELNHPILLSFFPSISISLLLLASVFLAINTAIAQALWMIGAALHLFFTLYVMNKWMHHDHFHIQHLNPAWFIPVVGNVLVPIAGVPLGFSNIAWFFFSIGLLFWILLLTIVFYRILFHSPLNQRLLPTLFILIAPPAVGCLAYLQLNSGLLDHFAVFLYDVALFLTLLLVSQLQRFIRLPFALSWWAYSFPSAAITLASLRMFEQTHDNFYYGLTLALFTALNGVIALLLVKTGVAVMKGKICVAES